MIGTYSNRTCRIYSPTSVPTDDGRPQFDVAYKAAPVLFSISSYSMQGQSVQTDVPDASALLDSQYTVADNYVLRIDSKYYRVMRVAPSENMGGVLFNTLLLKVQEGDFVDDI